MIIRCTVLGLIWIAQHSFEAKKIEILNAMIKKSKLYRIRLFFITTKINKYTKFRL